MKYSKLSERIPGFLWVVPIVRRTRNMNNRQFILNNLKEAKEGLDRIIADIENDSNFDFDGYYPDLQHIYHHLNTAWNMRKEKKETIENCSENSFCKWGRFPSEFDMDT